MSYGTIEYKLKEGDEERLRRVFEHDSRIMSISCPLPVENYTPSFYSNLIESGKNLIKYLKNK